MFFYTTTTFRDSLAKLTKKAKDGYTSGMTGDSSCQNYSLILTGGAEQQLGTSSFIYNRCQGTGSCQNGENKCFSQEN